MVGIFLNTQLWIIGLALLLILGLWLVELVPCRLLPSLKFGCARYIHAWNFRLFQSPGTRTPSSVAIQDTPPS